MPHAQSSDKKQAGAIGKSGKSSAAAAEAAKSHNSAPLTTLKDPSEFGAPPVHANRSAPRSVASSSSSAPKTYTKVGTTNFPESKVLATAPQGDGWGSPLPVSSVQEQQLVKQEEEVEVEESRAAPPVPYRANNTGLSTAGLPAPPIRRAATEEAVPQQPPKPAARPVPRPPPRLPPRQNSNPDAFTQPPPPPYTPSARSPAAVQPEKSSGYLNQGTVNRLGQAGVSVPGFGIGRNTPTPSEQAPDTAPDTAPQPAAPNSNSQMSELQARFNRMPGRVSSPTAQSPQATGPGSGTSWQQKQAALSTANKFQKDPSSISVSDAKEAGSTANNFRQRHGEQVAQGFQQAQGLDQRYGVSSRVGGLAQESQQEQTPAERSTVSPTPSTSSAAAGKKAPPPPPPKKKPGLSAGQTAEAPPPVPMSSKPTFN